MKSNTDATMVIAIILGVIFVALLSLLPAWLLMVVAAQFGLVKPLWVWWVVLFLLNGITIRSRATVKK